MTIEEPNYQLTVLTNGLLVATFPMPWLHETGVMLFVRAGSRFETDQEAGIAHFLEHMLFKGTVSQPDPMLLHVHLESLAADMNASTGQESNAYWLSLPPEHLAEGFATFCEIFTAPAFTDIDVERQVILTEMREDENDMGEIVNPAVLSAVKLWPNHPLARSVMGTRETIGRISVEGLRTYLARHYNGSNMAVAFFGPVDHEEGVRLTQQSLGTLPLGVVIASPPPPPMPQGPHWVAVNDQTSQYSLSIFFRCPGFCHPDYHAITALRRLLDDGFSSRLQATVREKQGLVYEIWASVSATTDTGTLETGATISPEHLPEVFVALLRELRRLATEPPDPEEWQRVMTRWHAFLRVSLDRPGDLLERYVADRLFAACEPLSETWTKVQAIDRLQLPQLAAGILQPTNMVTVLTGPQAKSVMPNLQKIFRAF